MQSPPPQQQQLVQVIGPNGQIQLVPASAVLIHNNNNSPSGSGSRHGSTTTHPLGGAGGVILDNNNQHHHFFSHHHHHHHHHIQQQQQPQIINTSNNPIPNFPAQGDLCFFNVVDDQELLRHLTASYGQVSVNRRTPEGAFLVRLFNSQQHEFCARQLNGQSIAPGRPPLTVGVVGVQ